MSRHTVQVLRVNPTTIRLAPMGRLGDKHFPRFREVTTDVGARYTRESGNTCPLASLGRAVAGLQRAGFTVTLAPELAALAAEQAADQRADIAEATARAVDVDDRLKALGKGLYPFQTEGAQFMTARRSAANFDEMGLGKTIQALIAIPEGVPVLVIGPAVAKGVWARETKRWRPDLATTSISGRGNFRWPVPGELVVTNYDVLPDFVGAMCLAGFLHLLRRLGCAERGESLRPIFAAPAGCVMIIDEAHAIGNRETVRAMQCEFIANAVFGTGGRVYPLTATPKGTNPPRMWNILRVARLETEAFGSWRNFVDVMGGRYEEKQVGPRTFRKLVWGTPDETRAGKCLQKVSDSRTKRGVLPQLPSKTYNEILVNGLTDGDRSAFDKALAAITAAGLDIDTLEGLREAQNSLEFQKISGFRARLAKIKIEAMLELVESYEEAEEPVVIFSAHRAPIDLLGKRAGWAIITGDTNPEKRTAIEEAFQRGELRGIGCTIRAGGVAITLTRSCNAILVDREWDPDLNDQAEDRILRIGQDRPVQITDIVVDHPLDRRVATVLRIKTRRHQASVCASERTTVDVADELYDVETSALIAVAEAELRVWAAGRNRPQNAPSAPQRPAGTPGNGATAVTAPGPAAGTTSTFRGRPARDAREMWAQAGLNLLAGADVDHAKEANTVGFNRMDTAFGHALYECLCAEGGLTDKQWAAALRMLPKYRRQIGAAPTALDEIKAAVA